MFHFPFDLVRKHENSDPHEQKIIIFRINNNTSGWRFCYVWRHFFSFRKGNTGQPVCPDYCCISHLYFHAENQAISLLKLQLHEKASVGTFVTSSRRERGKKKDPKSVYSQPAIFPASHFLFSAFTPSLCCSLLIIITSFCHKHTGLSRESNTEREHLINRLRAEAQTTLLSH